MKRNYYLTSFRKLNLSERITGHVEIIPGVNITNDATIKRRYLTPDFAAIAGAIEATYLENAPNLVFGELNASLIKVRPPEAILVAILLWINDLFKNAWLLKDHAMECEAAYLRIDDEEISGWYSNFLGARPSFANCDVWDEIEMSIAGRLTVFATVKAAYGIRSKLVHGSTLKAKQLDGLQSLSSNCDDYLRSILNAIFGSSALRVTFDSDNQAIEDYFSRLIFGN